MSEKLKKLKSTRGYENLNAVLGIELGTLIYQVVAESTNDKEELKVKDLVIHGLGEGSENWRSEYNNCRVLLNELIALKEIKDKEGETEDYLFRQPIAWEQAKEFLKDYQHE